MTKVDSISQVCEGKNDYSTACRMLPTDETFAITGNNLCNPAILLMRRELSESLSEAMSKLTPREALILQRAIVLEEPVKDIAPSLAISESRVGQIKQAALAKLRKLARRPTMKLSAFCDCSLN